MTKIIIRKIKHYPISNRYRVKSWNQRHKLVFKQPKATQNQPLGRSYKIQEKYDGTRIQLVDTGEEGVLINRRGVVKSTQFPELAHLNSALPGSNIIDGELIVQNARGQDDFKLLAEREHLQDTEDIDKKAKETPAKIMAFDALVIKGKDIMGLPFKEREKQLRKLLSRDKHLQQVKSYENTKDNFKRLTKKPGVEGVLFKDENSQYNDRKDSDWLKFKNTKEADVLITGYEEGEGKRKGQVGNMTMSVLKKQGVTEIGKVGTGWDEQEGRRLLKKLRGGRKVFAKIVYLKKGSQGNLREPSYKYERDDIGIRDTHASRPFIIKKKGRMVSTKRPDEVRRVAKKVEKALTPLVKKITVAGSIRRRKAPVDVDIVVIPKDKSKIQAIMTKLGKIEASGDEQVFARINGVPVDVFYAEGDDFGAQLMTRTGPVGANIKNRSIAKSKGMKLNQYGLFKGKKKVAGKTEAGIYEKLGKTYRAPEHRGEPR